MWHVWEAREVYTRFCLGDLREGDHLENQGIDGRVTLKTIFSKWVGGPDCVDMAQYRDRWWVGGGLL